MRCGSEEHGFVTRILTDCFSSMTSIALGAGGEEAKQKKKSYTKGGFHDYFYYFY